MGPRAVKGDSRTSGNGSSVVVNLTWNANGSLKTPAITDPLKSSNQQTCNYAYDDLARIASVSCNHWTQTFAFDAFGNIQKTGSNGGTSFLPTYSSSTNHMTYLGGLTPTYDADGNLTYDTYHNYTWDADGHPLSVTPNPTSISYDALGRWVETAWSDGGHTQEVYDPTGASLELMYQNGQTLGEARVPLPAGARAIYAPTLDYWHPDWLGSNRLTSTPSRTVSNDVAFAPYGETYVQTGCPDVSFTGAAAVCPNNFCSGHLRPQRRAAFP